MLNLDLDRKNDILYIKINDMSNSYGDETENGIVVFKDILNDKVTGLTIFDFLKRYREGKIKELRLPVTIDFDSEVYPNLKLC